MILFEIVNMETTYVLKFNEGMVIPVSREDLVNIRNQINNVLE